jgi:hypothetical protein
MFCLMVPAILSSVSLIDRLAGNGIVAKGKVAEIFEMVIESI